MGIKPYIWLAVTPDIYELPIAVANTAPELAQLLSVTIKSIYRAEQVSNNRHNDGKSRGFRVLKILEE